MICVLVLKIQTDYGSHQRSEIQPTTKPCECGNSQTQGAAAHVDDNHVDDNNCLRFSALNETFIVTSMKPKGLACCSLTGWCNLLTNGIFIMRYALGSSIFLPSILLRRKEQLIPTNNPNNLLQKKGKTHNHTWWHNGRRNRHTARSGQHQR